MVVPFVKVTNHSPKRQMTNEIFIGYGSSKAAILPALAPTNRHH
jgi:hypothetical protein